MCGDGVPVMSLEAATTLITTSGLPERERLPFWREIVCSVLGIDILPISNRPFFADVAAFQVKGIVFSHVRCQGHRSKKTDSSTRRVGRGAIIVHVLLRGKGRLVQDGREIELGPGDLSFVDTTRPFVTVTDNDGDDCEGLSVDVPRETWVKRIGPTEQITAHVIPTNTLVGGVVFNYFRQLIPGIGTLEPATADRLAETALDLLSTLAGTVPQDICRSSGRTSLLYRARTLIEENLDDPSLNPEKVARALRITERYLHYLFQEDGTTMSKWMWDRRLEKSRQKLSDPLLVGRNITEIAFSSGFSDVSHFGRRFRAEFSTSPSEFRRKQLANKPQ